MLPEASRAHARILRLLAPLLALCLAAAPALAQTTGIAPGIAGFDTSIIFVSPRPLISDSLASSPATYVLGVNIFLSGNGFGTGLFYSHNLTKTTLLFADLAISGARNTDEQEYYDPFTNSYIVPNKINRLFMFPLTIGAQFRLFGDSFDDTFRPYLAAGVGPSFILATPYEREFFDAFGHGRWYVRFGGYAAVGANIGSFGRNVSGISLRYYVIPFGGNGLESIRNLPITDFGGIFLALSVGWAG